MPESTPAAPQAAPKADPQSELPPAEEVLGERLLQREEPPRRVRVFMLGWEFPPYITGGLGVACEGLVRGLSEKGLDVTFVLPRPAERPSAPAGDPVAPLAAAPGGASAVSEVHVGDDDAGYTIAAVGDAQIHGAYDAPQQRFSPDPTPAPKPLNIFKSGLKAAPTPVAPSITGVPADVPAVAGEPETLAERVERYARLAEQLARRRVSEGRAFDVIHAHDWQSVPAALAVREVTGRPVVLHLHSLAADRAGESAPDHHAAALEARGLAEADRVVAVSQRMRQQLITDHDVDAAKITVVYNASTPKSAAGDGRVPLTIPADRQVVLFLGRITSQKGPRYFVEAAAKVLREMTGVTFVMAGDGDQVADMQALAEERGIEEDVVFTGFLRRADVEAVFRRADVYAMPSVSEPFGIAPLEALSHDVPVILSKTSGVAEVLPHALKVDFWDSDDLADKIVGLLRDPPTSARQRKRGAVELRRLRWSDAADAVAGVYRDLIPAG